MNFASKLSALLVIAGLGLPAHAEVKLPALFSDHMVLQQDKNIRFWGTATPGEKISVSVLNRKASVVTAADGKWIAELKPVKSASGPVEVTIKGQNTIVIKDVLIGEVWLCSGQSNMDMTVAKEDRYWCGVINEAQEVASASYPSIRVFDVDYTPSMLVQPDVTGKWEVCSPQTVGHFSAVAYFFARNLFQKYNAPIGLITSAYGASSAEAWISKPALEAHPNLTFLLDNYQKKWDQFAADSSISMPKYREALAKWKGNQAEAKAAGGDVNANRKSRAPRNPNPSIDQHNPYVAYNGMIAPLIPYSIRGAIWYQGESNTPTAAQYREIMETLVADWRKSWNLGNFPFLYVQLANYQSRIAAPVQDDPFVLVREAQFQNLSIFNTAMVVAIDNADSANFKISILKTNKR
jgi:sialate O-acetylesterase